MDKMNLCKIVGLSLCVGALIFALLGLYFVNYTTVPDANHPSDYPYLRYIIPSSITAIILFISGMILFLARMETGETTQKKYCQYCGSENKSDAVFCVKCGKQIDQGALN